ncbi:hypothetical protein QBC36DRAFT_40110 [Triangularia setosa]|uniref:Uncharacterized protein n=1 Tax=Triangularia setosa TaxID=2587417 RepID=A0AAN6WI97_9PEZI|nr:hypothetical protein QBC36DRAFT_40110 [Podospora setosa]
MAATLLARQYYGRNCTRDEDGYLVSDENCYVSFWNTKTGIIVKWSLFLAILLFFSLYLLIGYIHARKRVQAGLPPLGYHRFLVNRATLAQVDPRYRYPQSTFTPYHGYSNSGNDYQYYHMQGMPPPPVYDPNAPRPPVYEPPAGATKAGEGSGVNVAATSTSPPPPPPQDSGNGGYLYGPPPGPPPPPAAVVAPVPSSSVDQYAPPPGPPPPPSGNIQPQGTGNSTNPFRS